MSAPNNEEIFTLPPGRIVWGSVYKPQTKDDKGNPIIIKSGANQGQPGARWAFGVAIAKEPGKQWWETSWGSRIMSVGQRHPVTNSWQHPDFSWKITDGDSPVAKTAKGKAPNASEHNRGHWIIAFTTYAGAPAQFKKNPATGAFEQIVNEQEFLKPGWYVEVNMGVKPNTGDSPGLYMSPRMVAFVGYGAEIIQGPDVSEAGFGQAAAPAGAMAAPVGGGFNPSAAGMPMQAPQAMPGQMPMQAPQTMPGMMPAPSLPMLPQGAMPGQIAPVGVPGQMPQQIAVVPHTAILGMPQQPQAMPGQMPMQQPGMMAMPAPAARQPQLVPTQKANGATAEQFYAMNCGWTPQTLVDQGLMVWQ